METLQQVVKTDPNESAVLSVPGWLEAGKNTPESATTTLDYLARAIQSGSLLAIDFEKRAEPLNPAGRPAGAIAVLQQGIGVDPYYQRSYKALALRIAEDLPGGSTSDAARTGNLPAGLVQANAAPEGVARVATTMRQATLPLL